MYFKTEDHSLILGRICRKRILSDYLNFKDFDRRKFTRYGVPDGCG